MSDVMAGTLLQQLIISLICAHLCAILGGAAPAPSSGRIAAATIIPCIVASVLNYFMFL